MLTDMHVYLGTLLQTNLLQCIIGNRPTTASGAAIDGRSAIGSGSSAGSGSAIGSRFLIGIHTPQFWPVHCAPGVHTMGYETTFYSYSSTTCADAIKQFRTKRPAHDFPANPLSY